MMSGAELLFTLIALPFAGIAGGMLGRYVQRKMWLLDRPYAERVADLKMRKVL